MTWKNVAYFLGQCVSVALKQFVLGIFGFIILIILIFSVPAVNLIFNDGKHAHKKLNQAYHNLTDCLGEDWREKESRDVQEK